MAADLEEVEYGLIISVEPHFRSKDEIVSKVSLEMSVPTSQAGSQDLSLDKYMMNNTVSCKLGQSIILSGFLESMRNNAKVGTPILGDIPLLNFFFRNKQRMDNDVQVYAIITPRIMNAAEPSLSSILELDDDVKDVLQEMKTEKVPPPQPAKPYNAQPPIYPPVSNEPTR